MKLERVPVPTVGDKQVLIKVYSSGVNPVDTYVRSGQYKVLPDLPYIPGKDAAGVVHSVGASVTKFKRGDRVFSSQTNRMGTLAEYACVDEPNVFPLARSLSFYEGAAIGIPYFTAYRALIHNSQQTVIAKWEPWQREGKGYSFMEQVVLLELQPHR